MLGIYNYFKEPYNSVTLYLSNIMLCQHSSVVVTWKAEFHVTNQKQLLKSLIILSLFHSQCPKDSYGNLC
jgi:hypothetical protein